MHMQRAVRGSLVFAGGVAPRSTSVHAVTGFPDVTDPFRLHVGVQQQLAHAYSQVSASDNNKTGAFEMTWALASIAAAGLRSGTHTLTVRWRVEAF